MRKLLTLLIAVVLFVGAAVVVADRYRDDPCGDVFSSLAIDPPPVEPSPEDVLREFRENRWSVGPIPAGDYHRVERAIDVDGAPSYRQVEFWKGDVTIRANEVPGGWSYGGYFRCERE